MRAVRVRNFGAPGDAAVEAVDDPVPGADEVLIDVHAAPVNYVDLLVIGGAYQFKPNLPFVPGKGPAGVVAALGPGVDQLKVGDRVLAMAEYGGYAERAIAPASQCYPLPGTLSFRDAGALSLAYDTAWFALRERGRYAPDETVLVLGATGAVGFAGVQIAKALGARVLAAVSDPSKADLVADADAVIDLSQPDLHESLRAQVHAATEGKGADVVLDPLGGDIFDAALRAVAWRGRMVVIGFAAGRIATVATNYLLVKNIEVSGLQISDYRRRRPDDLKTCFGELFALYEAGRLRTPPVTTYPLDGFADALALLKERRIRGRAILEP